MSLLQVADLILKGRVRSVEMQKRISPQQLLLGVKRSQWKPFGAFWLGCLWEDFIQRCSGHARWEWRLQGKPRSPQRDFTVYTVWPVSAWLPREPLERVSRGQEDIKYPAGIATWFEISTGKRKDDGWMYEKMDAYTILNNTMAFFKKNKNKKQQNLRIGISETLLLSSPGRCTSQYS